MHQHLNDDELSMYSFNSSMNFAKLQNQINARTTVLSESSGYYKSKLQKFEKPTYGSNETLILDDIQDLTKMNIQPVKEADCEEEQSECNQQDSSQPRFSTESLMEMMKGGPGTEHEPTRTEQKLTRTEQELSSK